MKNELLKEQNILIEIQKINRIGLISDNEGAYYFIYTDQKKKSQLLEDYKINVGKLNNELT
jgi:hypothetical protein